jgi:proton-translocating NADH-quinone oxidoreductase chain M
MLLSIGLSPLIAAIIMSIIPDISRRILGQIAIVMGYILLIWSIMGLGIGYEIDKLGYQYYESYRWQEILNLNYSIGVDGISVWFIILTNLLILICIWLATENVDKYTKWFYVMLYVTQFTLLQVFMILEMLLFYISFEAVLIPMFLIIMIWGSRERKIHAAYQFFMYTLIGSFLFLLALFLVYSYIGTMDYFVIMRTGLSEYHQIILGIALFIAFAIKVPIFPFHIWLPEAHVEAPTAGSVLLAGIMSKMGTYGMLRYLLPLAEYGVEMMRAVVCMICIIGVFYTGLTTLRQIDMKKIIAYSSVGHMCFVIIGMFMSNLEALEGAIYLMITHGIISPALFLCIGIIYDRYGSRLYMYYGGIASIMPLYIIFFMLFTLANFSLPGTASFVAEILVIIGIVMVDLWVGSLLFLSGVIGLVYSLWLLNRVANGPISEFIKVYIDLTKMEFIYLMILSILTIVLGIYPQWILEAIHMSIMGLFFV